MRTGLRLALCQMNATVGDLAGNASRIRAGIEAARQGGAELVLFPELALTGYPPEDLLLREHFLTDSGTMLHELAGHAEGIVAIVGFPERSEGKSAEGKNVEGKNAEGKNAEGKGKGKVYNSAAVLAGGVVQAIYRKRHLPNYGVFDEQRYFTSGGPEGTVIEVGGYGVGLTVCEDLWVPGPPASLEAAAGASLIVNISASPYHVGKGLERERLFARRARETGAQVAFCAMVGGQDELVFDGHSFVLDRNGETIARAAQFEEGLLICDLGPPVEGMQAPVEGARPPVEGTQAPDEGTRLPVEGTQAPDEGTRPPVEGTQAPVREPISSVEEEVYGALLLGLHDYVQKNGFGPVVLGLSGGIDSALVACLAVDALGPERVNVAIMPSPYSSSETQDDARALAGALDVRAHELEIEPAMDAYAQTLRADFEGLHEDLTEENLQARIRCNLLMALSNKFGWLVLTTGNKSEMSVGYTTLYGDLAGGFAVIKDVPKTLVYRLSRWRNTPAAAAGGRASAPIPGSILDRPPSAELRQGQTDQDSLPPYDVLDRILHGYIELDRSREQLVAEGLPLKDVELATRLVDSAEYKRRQAPPGIKITERAFGRDRRMPITNAYRG